MSTTWIVWSPSGSTPPKFTHNSEDSAREEAIRLARLNPGTRFYWMRAEGYAERNDLRVVHLLPGGGEEDIPF